jgi:mannosidase alpha-like ER degradation enhancer 1
MLYFLPIQCNIRLLGGLISAHILAKDYNSQLKGGVYQDQLLHLAENLGSRFLPAFETPTGLPYAWINLKVHSQTFDLSDSKSSKHLEAYMFPDRIIDYSLIYIYVRL